MQSQDVNADLFRNISNIEHGSFTYLKKQGPGLDAMPDGAVHFTTLNQQQLKAIISANDCRDLDMHRNNAVSSLA